MKRTQIRFERNTAPGYLETLVEAANGTQTHNLHAINRLSRSLKNAGGLSAFYAAVGFQTAF